MSRGRSSWRRKQSSWRRWTLHLSPQKTVPMERARRRRRAFRLLVTVCRRLVLTRPRHALRPFWRVYRSMPRCRRAPRRPSPEVRRLSLCSLLFAASRYFIVFSGPFRRAAPSSFVLKVRWRVLCRLADACGTGAGIVRGTGHSPPRCAFAVSEAPVPSP
jgi:hypothetical protein